MDFLLAKMYRAPWQALFGTYAYIIIIYIQLATTTLLSFLLKLLRSETEMSPRGTHAERMSCGVDGLGEKCSSLGVSTFLGLSPLAV